MKAQVRRLWQLCFSDCEEFLKLYFRLRYTDKVNVAVEQEGEVIAALQMLPYPMTFCGGEIRTAYISGACTHPDHRNRGIMRRLLQQTFNRMWQEGVAVATLIPAEPWLFDYYTRSGFSAVLHSELPKWQDVDTDLTTASKHIYKVYREELHTYLDRKLRERPCSILHTREDFKIVLADLRLTGGTVNVWKQAGKIVAMEVSYPTPPPLTMGMARIIHAEEVLQHYATAYPEKELHIKLTDEQLPQNNDCYLISHGTCHKSAANASAAIPCTISELTQAIFAPLHPTMTLMMN